MAKALKILTATIHQSYFVVALCVGIIAGTITALGFRINFFSSPIWLIFCLVACVIAFIRPRLILFIIILFSGMLLAFFRSSGELVGGDYIRQFYNHTVVITGTVDGDPSNDEADTKFKLKNLEFGEQNTQKTSGNIYVTVKSTPELHRSDLVTIKGNLTEGFGTYAGYLYKPQIIKIKRPSPGDPVLNLRDWFSQKISRQIPEPESSLGLSYLLGMKTGLPDELNENLRIVGLVHIVVASGAHLSILVEIARKVFGKFSRTFGLLFSSKCLNNILMK